MKDGEIERVIWRDFVRKAVATVLGGRKHKGVQKVDTIQRTNADRRRFIKHGLVIGGGAGLLALLQASTSRVEIPEAEAIRLVTSGTTDFIDLDEQAAPGTPATADVRIYAKADGFLYTKDDAGVETTLERQANKDVVSGYAGFPHWPQKSPPSSSNRVREDSAAQTHTHSKYDRTRQVLLGRP